MTTLRKKAEVLAVMQAGGFVITRHGSRQNGYGLAALYDAQGQRVAAWQNAIQANIGPSRCRGELSNDIVRWWLP